MDRAKRMAKTYNSGDSLVVTHLTTNPPVSCLSTAERTGSAEFKILWSYVEERVKHSVCKLHIEYGLHQAYTR
ncbi:uncharacterized protein K460DRAFT_270036 [Cucurbitaria berberidis CBS 394.84]|uniref:Uncharacterized protein n=1 Tax=Cucurbitaria berberidis CBS 394.84 TaxID=1168544 RepID=A0A9P4GS14_9PLEO|nr:uncharacterized protein K460DRAFT_270036 [Cucurbitaria berberidis CBS 394.84]KAF1850469.1 hypothetical protein K460DRAFT_270036 [Cucurbitaria berberidis CBS 394.84]